MNQDKRIQLRVSELELSDWKDRAKEAGKTLTAWIRYCCNGGVKLKLSEGMELNIEKPKIEHTFISNWRTCGCERCVRKRKELG